MDNVKDDLYYLQKIVEDMNIIVKNTENIKEEDFEIDTILCDSVLFRIIQISENTGKLSEKFKEEHPIVSWKAIKGMRNRIVHEYGNVDREIIFTTITKDIPNSLDLLQSLLQGL